jgi:hypothetical protein
MIDARLKRIANEEDFNELKGILSRDRLTTRAVPLTRAPVEMCRVDGAILTAVAVWVENGCG